MGKKAQNQAQKTYGDLASKALEMTKQQYEASVPARMIPQNFYTAAVKGGKELSQYVGPQAEIAKQQFAQARNQIRSNLPRGGSMDAALGQASIQEAANISNLYSGGVQQALERLAALGTGQAQSAAQSGNLGIGGAGGLMDVSRAQSQAWNQAMMLPFQIGTMAGTKGLGGMFGGLFSGQKSPADQGMP